MRPLLNVAAQPDCVERTPGCTVKARALDAGQTDSYMCTRDRGAYPAADVPADQHARGSRADSGKRETTGFAVDQVLLALGDVGDVAHGDGHPWCTTTGRGGTVTGLDATMRPRRPRAVWRRHVASRHGAGPGARRHGRLPFFGLGQRLGGGSATDAASRAVAYARGDTHRHWASAVLS